VNDPVDRLIDERERMDSGFSAGVALSVAAHLVLVGAAFAAPLLRPSQPPLRIQEGFAVALPPGGAGSPTAAPEPPAGSPAPTPEAKPAAPEEPPQPAPKVLKPPKPESTRRKGLPEPDAKKAKPRPKKEEPATAYDPSKDPTPRRQTTGAGAGGTASATPGVEFGPAGPGVPGGTDWMGDWYLAGVQRKIWTLWMQQVKAEFTQPIAVRFTILADGGVADVQLAQSSGSSLLDLAAQRAVFSAAPFGPLPRNYGTNRYTIQAVFKPTGP
jgi:protein TonB